MDDIAKIEIASWIPSTLQEAHFATNISIGLKVIAGRHLLSKEVYLIISKALRREEHSMRLRFHAVIIEHFQLEPISNKDKIEEALDLMRDLQAHNMKY